ncbi:MAG: multiheme c-type cytochrome [Pseudomonadales bacterium]
MLRFLVFFAVFFALLGCEKKPSEPPVNITSTASTSQEKHRAAATYVGSEQCQSCHATEQQQWQNSDHHKAMMLADKNSVLGDFSAPPLKHHQQKTSFNATDNQYTISTDQGTPSAATVNLQYTFGVFPLQQYLTALPDGRWQSLPFAWDSRPVNEGGQQWFHLYANEPITPNDVLHWRSPSHNANHMCIECHNTDFKKNFQPDNNAFQSTWLETGVGCESCHGPGSKHIAWAKNPNNSQEKNKGWDITLTSGSPVLWKPQTAAEKPSRNASADSTQIERCAQCHSRRSRIDTSNDKEKFLDAFMPVLLDESLYFPDGQIQDEVYEYGSFLQSKMAQHGVTCSNCHNPHSGKVKIEGNGLCLQCHSTEYDKPKHTMHPPNTAGSLCVNCHMPERTYMTVDARRDHSMRIPRPDLTESLGTPNACNNCHSDKSAAWATKAIDKNTDKDWQTPHYGSVIAQARAAMPSSYNALVDLIKDESQPAIVRATTINLLPNFPTRDYLPLVINSLKSNDDLIKLGALRAAETLPPDQQSSLLPLLDDDTKAIRIEAARLLAGNPLVQDSTRFANARQEYIDSQNIDADRAPALTNLASLAMREQRIADAETLLKTAIQREPYYIPASANLADLYRALQRETDAERVLKKAMQLAPNNTDLMMSYALWSVRNGKLDEAVTQLQKATQQSENPRLYYLYALALQQKGKVEEAMRVLDKAAALPTYSRDVQLARVTMAIDSKQYEKANNYLKAWQQLDPLDPAVLEMTRKR